jgi:hypothetical protein
LGEGWSEDAVVLLGYSAAIGLPLAFWAFSRATQYARHRGSPAEY